MPRGFLPVVIVHRGYNSQRRMRLLKPVVIATPFSAAALASGNCFPRGL